MCVAGATSLGFQPILLCSKFEITAMLWAVFAGHGKKEYVILAAVVIPNEET